jgi:hypothetical protein
MVFTEGQHVVINHQRKGQFLAKVLKDFDTEKDEWAEVEKSDGDQPACRISFCKFKLATKEQVNGV